MKRAFSTLCCLEYTPLQILDLAKECGMDGVELRVDDRMLDEMTDVENIGREFSRNGIEICDIASSIFVRHADIEEAQYKYIDLAEMIGSKAVRVFAGESPAVLSDTVISDIDGIAEGLKKLCRYAAPKGIEIWLETHSELSTGKLCRQVLDMADMPNLKVLWDVMHSIEYREGIDETIAYLGHDIVHIHLKDGRPPENADKLEYTLTDLGDGSFPTAEVVSALKAADYDGYLSLEWESPWCPAIRHLYSDVRDLLKKYNEILDEAGV